MTCADQWSPWPFVALGVLFAGAGLVLLLVTRRGSDQPSDVGTEAPGSVVQT